MLLFPSLFCELKLLNMSFGVFLHDECNLIYRYTHIHTHADMYHLLSCVTKKKKNEAVSRTPVCLA